MLLHLPILVDTASGIRHVFKDIKTVPFSNDYEDDNGAGRTTIDESDNYDNTSINYGNDDKVGLGQEETDITSNLNQIEITDNIFLTGSDNSAFFDAMHHLKSNWQLLPNRSSIPVRDFSQEFLISVVPVVVTFLIISLILFGIFCTNNSTYGQNAAQEDSEESVAWEGFIESFFLVIKDCVSCCNVLGSSDKDLGNPLLDTQENFQIKLRMAEKQQQNLRSKRASSVQRQTDSLRRMAVTRDVTPRLQTPRPTSSLVMLADNRSIASESVIPAAGSMILSGANQPIIVTTTSTLVTGQNIESAQTFASLNRPRSSNLSNANRRSVNMPYDGFQNPSLIGM